MLVFSTYLVIAVISLTTLSMVVGNKSSNPVGQILSDCLCDHVLFSYRIVLSLFDLLPTLISSCDIFSVNFCLLFEAYIPCAESGGIFHISALRAQPRTLLEIHSLHNVLFHKYFLPAATTLCLKTGLPIFPSVLANGFIIAFNQTSNTSPKNCRIASSVWGLVGLFGIVVVFEDEVPRLAVLVEGGMEV